MVKWSTEAHASDLAEVTEGITRGMNRTGVSRGDLQGTSDLGEIGCGTQRSHLVLARVRSMVAGVTFGMKC